MTLALHGGDPIRRRPFPPRPPYGLEERNAANAVVASGQLSGFLAQPGEGFLGGHHVRSLEKAWCEKFGVRYAVSMNSATSCLFAAVQALGIGPGDEVIVTPWSMSASVSCVLAAGATPVFADIEPQTYGLDPELVKRAVTTRTRAIVPVHLFGHPARMNALTAIAAEYGLKIVEDAAQAVGAAIGSGGAEMPVGTLGDVGVFSLNTHKTIQCGEGGVAITDDEDLADGLRRYRNHSEVLGGSVHRRGVTHTGIDGPVRFGGNYRLGEIEAAIAIVQLGRLEELTEPRIRNAERLTEALWELDGISPPRPPRNLSLNVFNEDLRHVFYLYAVRVPGDAKRWAEALRAEGISAGTYVVPLHQLPTFWVPYTRMPVAQAAYEEVVVTPLVHAGMADEDVDDVIAAFRKVYEHRGDL